MNSDEYKKLLEQDEWKRKSETILNRDNFVCQECGCMGIQNNIPFKINSINDVDKLFENKLSFEGKNLMQLCEDVQWKNVYDKKLIRSKSKNFNDIYFLNEFKLDGDHLVESYYKFVSDKPFTDCAIERISYRKLNCLYDDFNIKYVKFNAFGFNVDFGKTNYARIEQENIICKALNSVDITFNVYIYFERKCYNLCFRYSKEYNKSELDLLKLKRLNVHHKYYVLGKKPWEYDNDALETLCLECHKNRHKLSSVPIYQTSNNEIPVRYASICRRCNGTGYLPQYKYYENGICFECGGEGVVLDDL